MIAPSSPLTPAQKLRIASSLYQTAQKVKAAAIARKNPAWSEARVQKETLRRLSQLRD